MRLLHELIADSGITLIQGDPDTLVNGIRFDSRTVEPGDLFVAVTGTASDGHDYIETAIGKGAVAVVCERLPERLPASIVLLRAVNTHYALGVLASAFYGNPSQKLRLVGVTGTNGKTTTVTLLHQLFLRLGYTAGLISTIKNVINGRELTATHTTPDPVQLNNLLAQMVDEGCEFCFMEVSSHAVDQERIAGLHFTGGVFTNLTHDHLDYHKTFDAYLQAKKKFFDRLPAQSFALVNKDDRNGLVMVQNCQASRYIYSVRSAGDFKCRIVENQFQGLLLNIENREVWFRLVGEFNAYNLLAVYGTAVLLGQEATGVLTVLSSLDPVNGRFNAIRSKENITAIVDYAHTPDALKNVLETINGLRTYQENLITVVGAGGNRDTAKRPVMAKIACHLSNRVILTSDNPRNEEPGSILAEMMAGVGPEQKHKVLVITDRREAIKTACAIARTGDIILVAGKGHETYQEIKGVRHHFDDREILSEILMSDNS